jgi:hypothetical protein
MKWPHEYFAAPAWFIYSVFLTMLIVLANDYHRQGMAGVAADVILFALMFLVGEAWSEL